MTERMSRVKPINYAISIHDIELGGAYSYQGTVHIDLDVRKTTKEIVVNAHQLQIKEAQVFLEHGKSW